MKNKLFLLPILLIFCLVFSLAGPGLVSLSYASDPVDGIERLMEEMRQRQEEEEEERKKQEEKRKKEMERTINEMNDSIRRQNQQMLNQQMLNQQRINNSIAITTNMIIREQIKRREDCVKQGGEWKEGKCYIEESPEPLAEPAPNPVYIPSTVVVQPSPSPSPVVIKPGPAMVLNQNNSNIIPMDNITDFIKKIANSLKFPQLFKLF